MSSYVRAYVPVTSHHLVSAWPAITDVLAFAPDANGRALRSDAGEEAEFTAQMTAAEACLDEALRTVAPDGRYVVIGFAAGGIPTVKLNRVLFRNISIVGAAWGEYIRTHPDVPGLLHDELLEMIAAGMRPPVNQTYPLAELPKALTDLAEGRVRGKAVVQVSE